MVILYFVEEETRNFSEIIKKVISKFFLERSGTSEFTPTPLDRTSLCSAVSTCNKRIIDRIRRTEMVNGGIPRIFSTGGHFCKQTGVGTK